MTFVANDVRSRGLEQVSNGYGASVAGKADLTQSRGYFGGSVVVRDERGLLVNRVEHGYLDSLA
jgi:hypothetical protein